MEENQENLTYYMGVKHDINCSELVLLQKNDIQAVERHANYLKSGKHSCIEGNLQKPTEYLDENGLFKAGNPGGGRPKDTEADKLKKKATKEIIKEYKEALGEALPMIQPILLAKALEGDMTAIKEIHDRVMDKARQNVGLDGGEEGLAIQFASVFNKDEETIPS